MEGGFGERGAGNGMEIPVLRESAWYMWQDGCVHGGEGIYCACALAGAASLISLLERCETEAREYMGLLP